MYQSKLADGKYTDGEVLKYCYQSLAAGIDYKANFSVVSREKALKLVRYAAKHELDHPTDLDGNAAVWPYFGEQLSNLVNVLGTVSTETAKKDAEWANELLQIAMEHPNYLRLINMYVIIKRNWDELKNLSITYRLLYAMAVMTTWTSDKEIRE